MTGASSPAARAWCRSWHSDWRARPISSTSTASRRSRRLETSNGKLAIGACVRHAAFYQPVAEGPLGRLLATVVRHIAPSSDPHPRHLLRQSGACRSGIRMVPGCRYARCRDRRHQHARDAHDRGGRFLCRHHDDRAGGRRIADRGAAAAPAGGYPFRLLGIQPPRRRLRARHGAGDLSAQDGQMIVEPRIGVGGAEATARRIAGGREPHWPARCPGRRVPRRRGSRRHGHRSA